MGARILFQLVLFTLPFILFGVYRLAIAEAEQEGRKPWPIRLLFGVGLALAGLGVATLVLCLVALARWLQCRSIAAEGSQAPS